MDQTCGTSLAVQGLRLRRPNTGFPTQEALLGCQVGGTGISVSALCSPRVGVGATGCLTKQSQTLDLGPSTATVLPTGGASVLLVMWDLAP